MKYTVPIHFREDRYLDKLIKQKFVASLMSDSKWVRLIAALVDNWFEVKRCLVKPIWDDSEPFQQLLLDEHTYYGFDYYATAMESMVLGNSGGWYAYKEIEWLDFPRMVAIEKKTVFETQNLERIKEIIENNGQFSLELTPDNLRLYAYFK